MFVVEDRGIIFDATQQPPERRIAYFTSLCLLKSGTILCGFQSGPSKHAVTSTVRLCRSADGGRNWELMSAEFETKINGRPGSLGGAEMVEVAPGRILLCSTWFDRSEPERPLFDPVTEGILHSKQLLAVSNDEGQTWSPWRELSTGELKGCALTGPLLHWDDGTIGISFESFKEFDDLRPGRHAAWLTISRDGGESFLPPLQVAQHPQHEIYYWDQRLCPGHHSGEFTALFWTHHLIEKRDLDVHLRHGCVSVQSDGTATIECHPIHQTPIRGQIAAPCYLPDGRLVAFVVDRNRPGTLSLWCSSDRGINWPPSEQLVLHTHEEQAAITQGSSNIDFKQYWEDMVKWSFGHPAVRLLDPSHLLLAWYAGSPTEMSLHWARVRT